MEIILESNNKAAEYLWSQYFNFIVYRPEWNWKKRAVDSLSCPREQCMDGGRSVEQKYETGCVSAISGVNLH